MPTGFDYPASPHSRRHGPEGYADYRSYHPWLRDEFTFRCVYCLKREQWGLRRGTFDLDHFEPASFDPEKREDYDNLVYSCHACNLDKSNQRCPNPECVLTAEQVIVHDDGVIEGLTEEADRLIQMLDLDDDDYRNWREMMIRILQLARERDPELYLQHFLIGCSSGDERTAYLVAVKGTETGKIRVGRSESAGDDEDLEVAHVLANIQEATGKTRRDQRTRLMRSFNTPFFPDILVCSQVMGEGVDLQRNCRHVIHHDLAWNPSSIEQRTGRIDRIGCKAESTNPQQSIHVYLPYLSGTADERQYRVMKDREQWFRIVMGQDEVAKLIPCDDEHDRMPLPAAFSQGLMFRLGIMTRG